MEIKRVHFNHSVNIQNHEQTYLQSGKDGITMELVPELQALIVTSQTTKKGYEFEQILTPISNVKYIAYFGDMKELLKGAKPSKKQEAVS